MVESDGCTRVMLSPGLRLMRSIVFARSETIAEAIAANPELRPSDNIYMIASRNGLLHEFDLVAALIVEAVRGGSSHDEIVELLMHTFAVDEATVRADVRATVDMLVRCQVMQCI